MCSSTPVVTSCAAECGVDFINDPVSGDCVATCSEGVLLDETGYMCDACSTSTYVTTSANGILECALTCSVFVIDEIKGVQELY